MSQKYHQLKQTKYIWLYSKDAEVLKKSGTKDVEFQWTNVGDLKLSNNALVAVCGFQSLNSFANGTPTGRIFRCKNIPNNQVIDTTFHSYPIIHMTKNSTTLTMELEPIKYNIGSSENWKTINIIVGTSSNVEYGLESTNNFVIGLKFEDYDVVEVQSKLMPEMKDYHKLPQDRLQQKYI